MLFETLFIPFDMNADRKEKIYSEIKKKQQHRMKKQKKLLGKKRFPKK